MNELEKHNKLRAEILQYLHTRKDLFHHGKTTTEFFKSWSKEHDRYPIRSKKPHGSKNLISVSLYVFALNYDSQAKHGVEIKIEMYLWGYQSEESMFQGWVESLDEFKTILKCVGL